MAPLFALFAISFLMALFAFSPSASAAQTIPYKMNFQGRLAGTTGMAMADGTYNMRFRIYAGSTCATGCTASWTEDRLVSAAKGVTVTGGLFSVQLGDVTALSPSLFTNQDLFFEVELPTTASATTSSPIWTEGAMTPRNKMGSAAYAFNADTIDGIDGASLAQLGAANAFTGNNTYSGTSTYTNTNTVKVTSSSAFAVQNAGGTSYLSVDTSSGTVTLGTGADTATFTSGGLVYAGNARPSRQVTLSAEYPGATFTGDGTSNTGALTSDFCMGSLGINATGCSGVAHNYYQWANTQATPQDYDIYVRYQIPSDYSSGSMSNLSIWGWSNSNTVNEIVTVSMYVDTNGTACATTTNAVGATTSTWTQGTVAAPLGSCTVNAGDMVTFKVRLQAGQNFNVRAGGIKFLYRSTR